MIRPFRWEVNVQTGERTQIELTDAEIERGLTKKAAEDAAAAIQAVEQVRNATRQARLNLFLDKLETDPTILDRIR